MKLPQRLFLGYLVAIATLLAIAVPAFAERKEVDLRLPTREGENFDILLRRAETLARVTAQNAFDQEILVSDVSIKITAQDQNQAAMLIQMNVSRSDWMNRPDARAWSRYFLKTQSLLGLK